MTLTFEEKFRVVELQLTHEGVPRGFLVRDLDFPSDFITVLSIDFNNFAILLSSIDSESSGLTMNILDREM